LKVQNEYDQIPSGLLDRLKRILPFANIVADKIVEDKIVCEETDLLEEIIPRMYEVIHRVAKFSYEYVTHGRSSSVTLVASTNNCSENGGRVGLPGADQRNRE